MGTHQRVSAQKVRSGPVRIYSQPPALWKELAPSLQRQLAQQWAKLIQQIRQSALPEEEANDAGG
jgi:hypothetical protein